MALLTTKLRLTGPNAAAVNRWLARAGVMLVYVTVFLIHVWVRGHADNAGYAARSVLGAESFVFHGVPSLWLQRWTPQSGALDWLVVGVHALPLVALPGLVLLVSIRAGPAAALRLIALQAALIFSADVFFAVLPTRPPWMDTDVTRILTTVYGHTTSVDDNSLAAVPSLHVAAPWLYTLWFARQRDSALRRLGPWLAVWTLVTGWAVCYGGEHYAVDLLAGVAWATAVVCLAAAAIPVWRLAAVGLTSGLERTVLAPSGAASDALPIDG